MSGSLVGPSKSLESRLQKRRNWNGSKENLLKTTLSPEGRRGFLLRTFPVVILLLSVLLLSYSVYFLYFSQVNRYLLLLYLLGTLVLFALGAVLLVDSISERRAGKAPEICVRNLSDCLFSSRRKKESPSQSIQFPVPTREEERAPEQVEKPVEEQRLKATSATLRRRTGRKSRTGAIVLLILSVILIVISYLYPNIVVEVDSVVAFAAALVLIYRDTIHSVQLRVVDRILDSSHAEASQLASMMKFPSQSHYVHEMKGEKISDVFLVVPSSSSLSSRRPKEDSGVIQQADDNNNRQSETIELIPPGRSLAQLFLRELAKDSPNLQDLSNAMQPIFSENLGLSFESSMKVTSPDSVSVRIIQPVLKSPCAQEGSGEGSPTEYSLVCAVCSLLAVLVCYASKRPVSIKSCYHDAKQRITSIEYHLEPKPEEEEQQQLQKKEHKEE